MVTRQNRVYPKGSLKGALGGELPRMQILLYFFFWVLVTQAFCSVRDSSLSCSLLILYFSICVFVSVVG